MRFHRWRAAGAALSLVLGGCQNLQHNDVMIFATDTKVAFDVSTSAVNGGAPEFTLGYKRGEAVWMPLLVNGASSTPLSGVKQCDWLGRNCKILAPPSVQRAYEECLQQPSARPEACLATLNSDLRYRGETEDGRRDAYSVFASFGADFAGSGGGRAALAQFFATGLAAQNLANSEHIGAALKVDTPSGEALSEAQARADAAERIALEATGATAIQPAIDARNKAVAHIHQCLKDKPADFKAAVAAAQKASAVDFTEFSAAADGDSAAIDRALNNIPVRNALDAIATKTCG